MCEKTPYLFTVSGQKIVRSEELHEHTTYRHQSCSWVLSRYQKQQQKASSLCFFTRNTGHDHYSLQIMYFYQPHLHLIMACACHSTAHAQAQYALCYMYTNYPCNKAQNINSHCNLPSIHCTSGYSCVTQRINTCYIIIITVTLISQS